MSFRGSEDPAEDEAEGPADGVAEAQPVPGMPGNTLKLTDPRTMRGLAHPARIAIFEHLVLDGPATATECAEVTGLSPSACSYHLRALAKYGFAEEDAGSAADGRQRPWRARVVSFMVADDPSEPTGVRTAGRLLQAAWETHFQQERQRYYRRRDSYSAEWQAAAGFSQSYVHVTAAELQTLQGKLGEVLEPYLRLEPAERPGGARRVMTLFDIVPAFEPEEDG